MAISIFDCAVDAITTCVPASVIVILLPDCKGLIKFPFKSPIWLGSDKTANKSCFNNKLLSTSVLVYVVDWFAFAAKQFSTCVFVYVVFWLAFNAKLLSVSVLL